MTRTKEVKTERVQRETTLPLLLPVLVARRPSRSLAALIVLNEINVSRNSNEGCAVNEGRSDKSIAGKIKKGRIKGWEAGAGRKKG